MRLPSDSRAGKTTVKAVFLMVLAFLVGVFLMQNATVVDIEFLFWKLSMSRVLMLLGAIGVGFIAGVIIGWEVFGKKKKDAGQGGSTGAE